MKRNRSTLKDYFQKGEIPTESNFADLIDSMLNQEEDHIFKPPNDPLSIKAIGEDEALINFYRVELGDNKLTWQVKQNPGNKPGLSIHDTTACRLYIESGTGSVGIGTTGPAAKLTIQQGKTDSSSVAKGKTLFVSGNTNPGTKYDGGFEFRHDNLSQGIGFGYQAIYATGTNSDQPLHVYARGTSPLTLNAYGGGNVGIRETVPQRTLHVGEGGQISLAQSNSVTTDSQAGIYWHTGNDYAIYRTPGPWTANTYQQLKIDWPTGIILEPGTGNNQGYDKSYVEITGGKGLRVTQGNVGVGTDQPKEKLDVEGTTRTLKLRLGDKWLLSAVGDKHGNDDWLRMFDIKNTGYYGGFAAGRLWTAQKILAGSDERLKKDIVTLDNSLDKITALRGVRFGWINPPNVQLQQMGLIAQEVERVFPEVVDTGPEGMKGIDYSRLIAPLIESIKQQQSYIGELFEKSKAHDNKINKQHTEIQSLKNSQEFLIHTTLE